MKYCQIYTFHSAVTRITCWLLGKCLVAREIHYHSNHSHPITRADKISSICYFRQQNSLMTPIDKIKSQDKTFFLVTMVFL